MLEFEQPAHTASDFTQLPALTLVLRGQSCPQGCPRATRSCLAAAGRGLEWLPADVADGDFQANSDTSCLHKIQPKAWRAGRAVQVPSGRSTWAAHCLNLFIYIQRSQVPFQVQGWPHRDKPVPEHGEGCAELGGAGRGKPGKVGNEPRCWMQTASKRAVL